MLPTATFREVITVACMVGSLALAGCKDDPAPARAPAPTPVGAAPAAATEPTEAPTAPPAEPATEPASSPTKIGFTLEPAREPGRELARRCRIVGDPWSHECASHSGGIAVARDGTLYAIVGDEIRRYTRVAGDECRYEPRGEALPLPAPPSRPQKLDGGPIYMRSGGPAWHLARAGNHVYAVDYLGGAYRVEGNALRPACTEVFGYDDVAGYEGKLLVARRGLEQLVLGTSGSCTAVSVASGPAERGARAIHAVRDRIYLATGRELLRYAEGSATVVAEGVRLCSVTDVTACGDGLCVLDNNCQTLVQLDDEDAVVRTLDSRALFASRPFALRALATQGDGAVLLLASHRDDAGGKASCEHALYELPAALFAR